MAETVQQSFEFIAPFPIQILARPADGSADWQTAADGDGFFSMPLGRAEYGIRARNIDDQQLYSLVKLVAAWPGLVLLNLSENRKISDTGLGYLAALPKLRVLNISSVGLSNAGVNAVAKLGDLEELDMSFCNRINDTGLRALRGLKRLRKLNLQGCIKVKNSGVRMIERHGLEIKK